MKSIPAATLIAFAFAAFAPAAAAQTGAPASTPSRPTKVATPPAPPPGGPDKLATHAGPRVPGHDLVRPRQPQVVDDFAGRSGQRNAQANHGGSTCYPGPLGGSAATTPCAINLDKHCTKNGGGMVENDDGTVTCIMPHKPSTALKTSPSS